MIWGPFGRKILNNQAEMHIDTTTKTTTTTRNNEQKQQPAKSNMRHINQTGGELSFFISFKG